MAANSMEIERLVSVDDALAAQLDAVFAVFDDGQRWDHEQGRRFLANPDNLFLVAWWDGRVCGFATAHRLQRVDRRRAEVLLYDIAVLDETQRRGVGRALVSAVKRWAADVGADEAWVLTDADNTAAMVLYASTGGHEDHPPAIMFTYRIAPLGGKA